ncbi:replicative DNA helicase [Ottowia sp. GY511]|uniref:DNA 5'-3' helicase n=1 Tax=Ottowia flava TaxID=2675430 RepID=A0ABW4KU56_9BURK|nr:replicative DNA helicase [Ottowia sp. GY511]TXK26517.1 replicative DNA helicase [Ottowia sp. GY511]
MNARLDDYATAELTSLESEASLVGALLLDNAAFDRISDALRPEHFSSDTHRTVFNEIARQLSTGKPADVVTVFSGLNNEIELSELNALAQYVPSGANIRRHAELVIERYKARQLAAVSREVYELAHDNHRSIEERVEAAQGQLARLIDDSPRDEWIGAHEGMLKHTQVLEDRAEGKIKSWPTGLCDLDDYLEGGLRPGSLVVLGARPSHGKTAMGMSIGLHMASSYSVALMSMEMPHRDVRDRMTAILGRVSLSSVIRPNKGEGLAWDRVLEGAELARSLNFYVTDQSGLNINQVRAKARNLRRLHGLNVLVVDYIGLMTGLDSKQSRAYQIEEVTKGLKSLAKELDICVIALAQLNRNIEQRMNRRPMLSDFRDSGSIEQDADIVFGLHREVVDKPDLGDTWKVHADLCILKNRQGRTGQINLHYAGEQTRFSSWSGPAPSHAVPSKAKRGYEEFE